jgi:hypothetical protein
MEFAKENEAIQAFFEKNKPLPAEDQ